jgi:hypothetical protein
MYRHGPIRALALACLIAAPATSACGAREPRVLRSDEDESLARFAWLVGAWVRDEGDRRVEEHWIPPFGGVMFGIGRMAEEGRTTFFEYLRIEALADGVAYVASPRGGETTFFALVEEGDARATFENPAHDFPTRITYWREGEALHARIEGVIDGEAREVTWVFSPAIVTP